MNYKIEKDLSEPAYLQLYRLLVKDIVGGGYPFGSRIPSKRVLAEETGVSVITVEHAMTLLCEEGYTESRQRSGIFVVYRGEDFLGKTGQISNQISGGGLNGMQTAPGRKILNEDGMFPFSVLAKTMRRVLLEYGEKLLIKSPNHGCSELREEICRYLARSRGLQAEPSQIIVGSGAEYLYGLIVQLLGTDRIYAIEDPSYKKIRDVYEAMGASLDQLAVRTDGIASEELARTQAQILHVTPFNSYPSGATASISKKHEYIRWARQREGVLIEDNYDSELTVSKKPEEPLYSIAEDVDVIYVNTFSRTIAPSMRIGYMVLPVHLTELFNRRLGFYSCTVPIFEQYVLTELLRTGDFERHINRVRRKRRKMLAVHSE